jgi:hypothetical protein
MPSQFRNPYGNQAAFLNVLGLPGAGYAWESGCGVILGGSTTDIELQVGAGSVIHDGAALSVSATSVTLADGDPIHPRKDLLYVDRDGNVQVQAGEAAEPVPADKERFETFVPAIPDATGIDGVPLAAVWVPPMATSTGDLSPDDKLDLRPQGTGALGRIPTRDSTPSRDDLVNATLWLNTGQNRLEYYDVAGDEIFALDQTSVQSFSGTNTFVIEDFEDSIDDNWRGGSSSFSYTTPAFEGAAAAFWDESGYTIDYSLPGDGLQTYPEEGDTASLAIYPESNNKFTDLGIAKAADDFRQDYRARLDFESGSLSVVRVDSDSVTTLGSTSVSLSADTWYIVEIDYDGGGQGVHPARVYSTSGGGKDTELAAVSSPTQDTTYRGRGVLVQVARQARIDRLTVAR